MQKRGDGSSRFVPVKKLLCAFLLMMFVIGSVSLPASAAGDDQRGGIDVLGKLPEPSARGEKTYLLDIDEKRHRLLYLWMTAEVRLREYDTRSKVPRLVREGTIGSATDLQMDFASPYTIAVDRERQLAFFKANSYAGTLLRVVDLKNLEVLGTWDLTSAAPGFLADGITYSPQDGRLYVVGAFDGEAHGRLVQEYAGVAKASAVLALDMPEKRTGTPGLAWVKPIPECQMPLNTKTVGSLIARSPSRPALYFGCVRPDPYVGQSGLVRLWIEPDADQAAAQGFVTEFFPISGSYTVPPTGVVGAAAFDPKSERFFMQSVSRTTPGTWVFDGKLSAWVGFIAAPDSENRFLGLNPATGRFYMASRDGTGEGDGGYLLVVDGRATPIPQGTIYPGLGTYGFLTPDPATGRLFVQTELSKFNAGKKGEVGFMVFEDNTPPTERPRPIDYDSLTSDLPEGPKTTTSYSAGINGFGSRAVLVGGYGGVVTVSGVPFLSGQVRSGDRGATFARLPAVDLRSVGASASAHAMVPDANTQAEFEQVGQGQPWPWRAVSCLDGNGSAVTDEDVQQAGYAKVECDLAKGIVRATSTFGKVEAVGVSVAGSSISATAQRDEKKGTVTEVLAEAHGIEIPTPQGTLSIAKVTSFASTLAHGHEGTAKTEWYRTISGVEVRDADGAVVQTIGGCDSREKENPCEDLETRLNGLAPTRFKASLPQPKQHETSKGAFAGVEQHERDYYNSRTVNNQGAVFDNEEGSRPVPGLELDVYNDGQEKSRLVLQLAALQANSIYTISPQAPAPEEGPVDIPDVTEDVPAYTGGGSIDSGTAGDIEVSDIPAAEDVPVEDVEIPTEAVPVATTQAVDGVLAFLKRTPQEALLVALVWMTFGGAGWAIFRRHQLLKVLGGNS